MKQIILGFDPGRDKCGVAIMDGSNRQILYHQIIESNRAIATIQQLDQKFAVELIVIGDGTTAKDWSAQIQSGISQDIPVVMVNEKNSTIEARDRYWQMYPPKGLNRLIPQGLRVPPRPVDDLVAILLIERYLEALVTS